MRANLLVACATLSPIFHCASNISPCPRTRMKQRPDRPCTDNVGLTRNVPKLTTHYRVLSFRSAQLLTYIIFLRPRSVTTHHPWMLVPPPKASRHSLWDYLSEQDSPQPPRRQEGLRCPRSSAYREAVDDAGNWTAGTGRQDDRSLAHRLSRRTSPLWSPMPSCPIMSDTMPVVVETSPTMPAVFSSFTSLALPAWCGSSSTEFPSRPTTYSQPGTLPTSSRLPMCLLATPAVEDNKDAHVPMVYITFGDKVALSNGRDPENFYTGSSLADAEGKPKAGKRRAGGYRIFTDHENEAQRSKKDNATPFYQKMYPAAFNPVTTWWGGSVPGPGSTLWSRRSCRVSPSPTRRVPTSSVTRRARRWSKPSRR